MKQITFASILLAAATLFTVCSKDAPGELTKQDSKENITTLDAGSLRFNFVEEGFGKDVEQTRAEELSKEEIVDVGNGLEAHISVERDAVPATRAPKPIADGNYTILAYKGTQLLDQKITFKVVGGVTSVTSTKGRYSWVANETYTFVCFNEHITDNNDGTLTVGAWGKDKEAALLGRQTITINGADQNLTFQMKHVCMRIRTKLVSLQEYPQNAKSTLWEFSFLDVISVGYNILSEEYDQGSTMSFVPPYPSQTFQNSGTKADAQLDDDLYTVTNEYVPFYPAKDLRLAFNTTNGQVYGKSIAGISKDFYATKANGFKANGSYTMVIKLFPRYRYLFENGETGYLSDPNRVNNVPIAIVFDTSGRRAISLWDANGGNGAQWNANSNYEMQANSTMFANATPHPGLTTSTSGHVFTYEHYDSYHISSPIAKSQDPQFPAFYHAAKYYTDANLLAKAGSKSNNLTGALANDGKWYLPSWYEWKEVYGKLGLGNEGAVTTWGERQWLGSLINYAFVSANGTSIAPKGTSTYYWSSSENDTRFAFIVDSNRLRMAFNAYYKNWNAPHVRPFVNY